MSQHALPFPPPTAAADSTRTPHQVEIALGFDKERATMLHLLLPAIAALAFIWFGWFVDRASPLSWLPPLLLLGTVWAAYMQIGQRPLAATALTMSSLLAAVAFAVVVLGNQPVALLLVPIASAAMMLIGVRFGLSVLACATAMIVGMPAAAGLSGDMRRVLLVAVWSGAWLSWVTFRSQRLLMTWAWQHLAQVQTHIDALRDSRGELARTLHSLDHAYYRLQQANADLERARYAAEEARRYKAEFAANISHELRTPLNLILGFSELMILAPESYGEQLPPAYRSEVEAIYRNARHLSSLVDDVLDLSGIEANRMALLFEQAALQPVIEEAIAAVETLFTHRGLYVRLDMAAPALTATLDRTRMRQVLINLLANAVRFTAHGGVTVRVAAGERTVLLAVCDTGIGIDAEKLTHVFDEFEQLGAVTHRTYGGSGLGLAISKKFVELHGGRIWVESVVGQGTNFFVELPLTAHDRMLGSWGERTTSWASAGAQGDTPLLLVIDDDPWTARVLARYLDDYRVLPFGAADDAQPQALLVNVHDDNHTQALHDQAAARYPHVPLFTCALPTRHDHSALLGADDYLPKPVDHEQLHAALARLGRPITSIVIIDDDPDVVRLLTRMLATAPEPYAIAHAQNGADGLELVRELRPDVVLLDLLMPHVDGYTVVQQVRSDPAIAATAVIVVSARGYAQEVIRARTLGCSRAEGFSVGSMVAWLRASLAALS